MQKIIIIILIFTISFATNAQQTEKEKEKERNAFMQKMSDKFSDYRESGNYDKNGNKTGVWKSYYKNGDLKTIGSYKNGKKEGEWKLFFYNKLLCEVKNYKDGLLSGLYQNFVSVIVLYSLENIGSIMSLEEIESDIRFYMYGDFVEKGYYEKGKKVGKWIERTSHTASQEGNYKDGEKEGEWEWVDFYGYETKEKGHYHKGKKTGEWVTTFNYKIRSKGHYLEGKKTGKWIIMSGKKREEGNFVNDKRDGKWKYYYENGKIEAIRKYKEGKNIGKWKYYNEDGKKIKSKKIKKIDINAKQVIGYYPNGELLQVGYLDTNKNPTGEWRFYANNGLIEKEGTINGKLAVGKWKFYDKKGTLEFTGNFNNKSSHLDGKMGKEKLDKSHGFYDLVGSRRFIFGRKTGEWKYYDKDGLFIKTIVYSDGIKKGIPREYCHKLIEEGILKDGSDLVESKVLYDIGKPKKVSTLILFENIRQSSRDTKPEKIFLKKEKWYYENGKLESMGKRYNEKKIGIWKYYDKNNKLTKTVDHK